VWSATGAVSAAVVAAVATSSSSSSSSSSASTSASHDDDDGPSLVVVSVFSKIVAFLLTYHKTKFNVIDGEFERCIDLASPCCAA
jgi:hypothetical protein